VTGLSRPNTKAASVTLLAAGVLAAGLLSSALAGCTSPAPSSGPGNASAPSWAPTSTPSGDSGANSPAAGNAPASASVTAHNESTSQLCGTSKLVPVSSAAGLQAALASAHPGETIMLLGTSRPEFGGSLWAFFCQGHLGGLPPEADLAGKRRLAAVLAAASEGALLSGAHDLSDGGLAVALAESCLTGATGCAVRLPGDAFTTLFSESAARAVVSVPAVAEAGFSELCAAHGVPAAVLGRTGGDALEVTGQFAIPLDELRTAHERTLPALFD